MKDKTWTDKLSDEDVVFLGDVEVMSANLISQVYIFIDLFHQYIDLVQSAAIFSPDFVQPESNDANVSPTQTLTATNRSDRRAQEKKKSPPPQGKKTPFDVAKEKGHTPNV
jgi:hypothetical protein